MAKKNDYLAKKRATERAFFDAGLQMGRQQIIDMLCLVLHDPEVMGKDTFGRERLNKVVAAIGKKIDYYHKAWLKKDDTDAYRVGLDNALADAFGEESLKDSFLKRYEYSPEYDYITNKWKG